MTAATATVRGPTQTSERPLAPDLTRGLMLIWAAVLTGPLVLGTLASSSRGC